MRPPRILPEGYLSMTTPVWNDRLAPTPPASVHLRISSQPAATHGLQMPCPMSIIAPRRGGRPTARYADLTPTWTGANQGGDDGTWQRERRTCHIIHTLSVDEVGVRNDWWD